MPRPVERFQTVFSALGEKACVALSLFVRCQFTEKIAGHRNQLWMLAELGHQRKQGFKHLLLVHLFLRPGWFTFLHLLVRLFRGLLVPSRRSRWPGAREKL